MPTPPLPQDLAALIHHVELSKAGWRTRALRRLLLATTARYPTGASADRVYRAASAGVPGALVRAEVEGLYDSLVSRGHLVRLGNDKFKLSEDTQHEFHNRMQQADRRAREVQDCFRRAFSHLPDTVELTWSTFLTSFLEPLVSELGAKTYHMLTGQQVTVEGTSAHALFISTFRKRDQAIVCESISRFLAPDSDAVRQYVLRLLNTAFLVQALALPKGAMDQLLQRTRRHLRLRVFVDTNFMFSLLGLHVNPADDVVHALHDVIARMPSRIDVKLYMLPSTMEEARETIARYAASLSAAYRSRKVIAAIREGTTNLSGIPLTYFREAFKGKQPISAKDYFAPYLNNFVEVARSKGIELYNTPVDYLRDDQEVIDDLNDQLERENQRPEERRKSYKTLLHDMILWHFTRRQRPAQIDSPLDAEAWVATIDGRLLGFDAFKAKKSASKTVVCIHPTVLLHVLQFWVPSSDALSGALMESLRPMPPRFDHQAETVTVRIINSLSRFENVDDLSTDAVTNVLLSDGVRSKIANARSEREDADVIRIEIAEQHRLLELRAKRYRETARGLKQEVKKGKEAIGALTQDVKRLADERGATRAKLQQEMDARETLERRVAAMERDSELAGQEAAKRVEMRSACRRALFGGTVVLALCVLVVSLGGIVAMGTVRGLSLRTVGWAVVVGFVGSVMFGAGATRWLLKRSEATRGHRWVRTAKKVMVWCGALITAVIAGAIVEGLQ